MPYERVWLNDRESRRKSWLIGDLEARHAVRVACRRCRRQSLVAPHELHARHRATVGLAALKFTCRRCGCREVAWHIVVARPPPTARSY